MLFFIEKRSILLSDWRDNKDQTAQELAVFLKRDEKVRILEEYRRQSNIFAYLQLFEYSSISTDMDFFRILREFTMKTGMAPESITLSPDQINDLLCNLGEVVRTGCHATLKWVRDNWKVDIEQINCFLLTRGAFRVEGNALSAVIDGPFIKQYYGDFTSCCIEATLKDYADLSEILWDWDGKSDINALAVSKLQVITGKSDSEKWYKHAATGYIHYRFEVSVY
jgi:hypothetical protein